MSFRKPITTLGGLLWWENIKQNDYFLMQKHKVGIPIWPYKYRIIMRANRMEIANSNDIHEIEADWNYLKNHAVPRLNEAIDIHKEISQIDSASIVIAVIKIFL